MKLGNTERKKLSRDVARDSFFRSRFNIVFVLSWADYICAAGRFLGGGKFRVTVDREPSVQFTRSATEVQLTFRRVGDTLAATALARHLLVDN